MSIDIIIEEATRSGMFFVVNRWLGGTLTNFRTIRSRLKRLEELEAIEQADNFASYSKKMESQLRREKDKMKSNLDGIRKMDKIPGAIIAVDVKSEITALKEARKLGVPTICLIDTDGDPELVDIPIPGNDDSMRSIEIVLRELCLAVVEGKQQRQLNDAARSGGDAGRSAEGGGGPRRSRRSQFRADGSGEAPEVETASGAGEAVAGKN